MCADNLEEENSVPQDCGRAPSPEPVEVFNNNDGGQPDYEGDYILAETIR
jgi:hypothetical protein